MSFRDPVQSTVALLNVWRSSLSGVPVLSFEGPAQSSVATVLLLWVLIQSRASVLLFECLVHSKGALVLFGGPVQ